MYIFVIILFAAVLLLTISLCQYKRQIKSFTQVVKKRRDMDVRQPVTVDFLINTLRSLPLS